MSEKKLLKKMDKKCLKHSLELTDQSNICRTKMNLKYQSLYKFIYKYI